MKFVAGNRARGCGFRDGPEAFGLNRQTDFVAVDPSVNDGRVAERSALHTGYLAVRVHL
jgi:hypothetical protein